MCGIAGYYCRKGIDQDVLDRMGKLLLHRGPDSSGIFVDKNIGLGHTRLSIIDLSKLGSQPMNYNKSWKSIEEEIDRDKKEWGKSSKSMDGFNLNNLKNFKQVHSNKLIINI